MQVRVDTEEDRSGLFRETRTVHARLVHSCQRCYHIRLLVHQSRGLHQTHTDMVSSLKHTYVCSEERAVVHRTVLTHMEVGARCQTTHASERGGSS